MTKFEQFELVYNQFVNMTNEIDSFINGGKYQIAAEKVKDGEILLKKMFNIKKTIELTDEEQQKILSMEKIIWDVHIERIKILKNIQEKLRTEIKSVKKKTKINSAYIKMAQDRRSILVDCSE
jgi:hypothetical protein